METDSEVIWAKATEDGKCLQTLTEHTHQLVIIMKGLIKAYHNIPMLLQKDNFFQLLFLAAFFHDTGKAIPVFQRFLRKLTSFNDPEWIRHEIASAVFADHYLNDLVPELSTDDQQIVLQTILLHHKNIRWFEQAAYFSERTRARIHRSIEKLLHKSTQEGIVLTFDDIGVFCSRIVEEQFSIDIKPVVTGNELTNLISASTINLAAKVENELTKNPLQNSKLDKILLTYDLKENPFRNSKILLFLKGMLNTCDYLASSMLGEDIVRIRTVGECPSFYPEIWSKLNFTFRGIQEDAICQQGDVFASAPTGSGKTEAALLWMEANQNKTRSRRIFYVLPFTASINAMYERISGYFGENHVSILHYRVDQFLYEKYTREGDNFKAVDPVIAKKSNGTVDINKLVRVVNQIFHRPIKPVKIITPFQIIKNFYKIKGFEMNSIEYANSLFILDEIHLYNPRLLGQLTACMKFLKEEFQVDFLLMSATLPSFMKELLKEKLLSKTAKISEINVKDKALLDMTRHKIQLVNANVVDEQLLDVVKLKLIEGLRVLIVCNTVTTAQKMFARLKKYARNPQLLHSRFCPNDRMKKERRITERSSSVDLLVGTQAIEVSLDIDYDILISEVAPLDALIQRMGRVYRKRELPKNDSVSANVLICLKPSENDHFIYKHRLEQAKEFLKEKMKGNNHFVSNLMLKNLVEEFYPNYTEAEYKEWDKAFNDFYDWIVTYYRPGFDASQSEKELFYSEFDSVDVIPSCYKNMFLQAMQKHQYFVASSYYLSISKKHLEDLKKRNKTDFCEEYGSWVVNIEYDPELGWIRANIWEGYD
ncbi:MAG: CRISPR-associated helicase Cas3' [Candidatus Odinarchaeota archaeon]